jgi:hypothetical protein
VIALGLSVVALAAAPHVVVVKRSELGISADKVVTEVAARLNATVGVPCPRDTDCLTPMAFQTGVDVAVGVSVVAGPLGNTVDLEAVDHYGRTIATWTGKLPLKATEFFRTVLQVEPFQVLPSGPPPSHVKPSTPLLISAAILAAGAVGMGVAGLALQGPLNEKLQMKPVIIGLTRDDATQQVNQVNALFTACLVLSFAAASAALAGAISLLF